MKRVFYIVKKYNSENEKPISLSFITNGNVFKESLKDIIKNNFKDYTQISINENCLNCKYYKVYCNGKCFFKK